MNELKAQRKNLDELKHLTNSLNIFKHRLPPFLFTTDLNYMLDEIKYLSGYINCMIKFNINPLPESE